MPLYEFTSEGLRRHSPAGFAELGLLERGDLQRRLRDDIAVLDDDLLVVAEEYGEWEDARRRIDLLAIDKAGRLVVIELKRTEGGGHMELQALRYAAMVSALVFHDVVTAYASHLAKVRPDEDVEARAELKSFLELGPEDDEDSAISSDVRIILVSANFSRELITTALWLNEFAGMDLRCIRLVPYRLDDKVLLDIQQAVPLPEAADYQVRVRRKDREQKRARRDGRDFTRFHVLVGTRQLPDENKRNTIRVMVEQLLERGASPERIGELLSSRKFRSVEGVPGDRAALVAALRAQDPRFDEDRWFLDHPFVHNGRTWVLSKMWGRDTERVLSLVSNEFPSADVSFRRADV